jgi:type II secretory pathway component PulJ
MMEAIIGIILLAVLGLSIWQIIRRLNQHNQRLQSDLNTIIQRCENLSGLVKDLQEEIMKMESQQQLVEK